MILISWGSNSQGQLGLGHESEQEASPQIVRSISTNVLQASGGGNHSFIVADNDKIYSCGKNDRGQLAIDPAASVTYNFQLLRHPFLLKVTKISCGWDFTLSFLESGQVYGWGANTFGQLGVSIKQWKTLTVPQRIKVRDCVDIGTGLRHSCLVTASGLVLCSGSNSKGQLGLGVHKSLPKVDSFTEVPSLRGVVKIACGEHFTLAVSNTSAIFVWGDNKFGQLGVKPELLKFSPNPNSVELPNISSRIKDIFCGWTHCSLLTDDGSLVSWGRDDYGQLGEERLVPWEPKQMSLNYNFKQLVVGSEHTIGLTDSGTVLSWGWNEHGNCGSGKNEIVKFPVPVDLPLKFKPKLIGTGYAHSFAFGCFSPAEGASTGRYDIEVLRLPADAPYQEFFTKCLLRNEPCIVEKAASQWQSLERWVTQDNEPNIDYISEKYGTALVTVAQCDKKIYNVHEKISKSVSEYANYWNTRGKEDDQRLYLKDWHFTLEFPDDSSYRVPKFFASDWLNEYYDKHPHLNDDYRFVYIGPKGTWTPLHADVFTSYSWSANVVGEKHWVLLRPGVEDQFRDGLGNFLFDEQLNFGLEPGLIYHIVQGPGDAIFVPSGWHHQVWNMKDTISINHNWINGCNIHNMWLSMERNLRDIENEIGDCKDMDDWRGHCQLMLKSLYGFNYNQFYTFLVDIIEARMSALTSETPLAVYGSWEFGPHHQLFDIKQALAVLELLMNDPLADEVLEGSDPKEFWTTVKDFLETFKAR